MSAPDGLRWAAAYATRGWAPVPLHPLEKTPVLSGFLDTPLRTEAEVLDAWEQAQQVIDHSSTHSDRRGMAPNVGLVLNLSGLACVDADTPGEVDSWLTLCAQHSYDPGPPTVRTPGDRDSAGAMKHRDGGHWIFDQLPADLDVTAGVNVPLLPADAPPEAEAAHLLAGRKQITTYPSVREEGPYDLVSVVRPLPIFLADLWRADQERTRQSRPDSDVEWDVSEAEFNWDERMPWLAVLPDGWELHSTSSDGHETYLRPGASSACSALAHPTGGCRHFPSLSGPGPMTLFTTNPGSYLDDFLATGRHSLTKVRAYAWKWYRGDMRQARRALGLPSPRPVGPAPAPMHHSGWGAPVAEPGTESVADTSQPAATSEPTVRTPNLVDTTVDAADAEDVTPVADTATQPAPVPQPDPGGHRDPQTTVRTPPSDVAGAIWHALFRRAHPMSPETTRWAANVERNAGPWHRWNTAEKSAEDRLLRARHVSNADIAAEVGLPPERTYALIRALMPAMGRYGLVVRERTADPKHDPREYKAPPTQPADIKWGVWRLPAPPTPPTTGDAA